MNPFTEKATNLEDGIMDWSVIYPEPYSKRTIDPYTKVRIVIMNGVETETILFKHQFLRNCANNDLRREIALMCRVEQQQQKHINWLKPIDETVLETTISYEHAEVDLAAQLAQREPNKYVKQVLDFILTEDLDHLYRFANLMDLDSQIPAQGLIQSHIDITPGRPSISNHSFPFDSVKNPIDFKTADVQTLLSTLIAASVEQQTMNFYMNLGNTYYNDLGRQLYLEIAMIEEQHAGICESLLDPNCTWLESLLLHEYMECYLYYSFYNDEPGKEIKSIWEMHFLQELSHLHKAVQLLKKYDNKDWQEVIANGEFPNLLKFYDTRDYVRQALKEQIMLASNAEGSMPIENLPQNHNYFFYQNRINHDVNAVASHNVIAAHQQKYNTDYRAEEKPNPVKELRNTTADNTQIAGTPKT